MSPMKSPWLKSRADAHHFSKPPPPPPSRREFRSPNLDKRAALPGSKVDARARIRFFNTELTTSREIARNYYFC